MLDKSVVLLLAYSLIVCIIAVPNTCAQDTSDITPEVVWTFETGGPIWGSSTSKDGIVYFGSTDGTVYALEVATGALAWSFETNGAVYGDVAVYDGYLYAGSDDGYLYKINLADGSEIWRFNIHEADPLARFEPGSFVNTNRGLDFRGPNPIEADGIVYVGSPDTHLYAIDAETATKIWHFDTNDIVRSTPAVVDDKVVFASYDGRVYTLDKNTGEERWVFDSGRPITPAPLVEDGVVYIGNRSSMTATGTLYALNLDDGEEMWRREWGEGSWVESSATMYDGTLYIGSSFWATTVAIDPATGAFIWQARVGGGAYSTPALTETAHYSGTVALDNNRGLTGAIIRLNRATGEEVWRYPFEAIPNRFAQGGVSASPELVDGLLLFGALDNRFYAIKENGVSVGVERGDPTGVPEAFNLAQNYPNPFNPATTIAYTLNSSAHVRLTIFDVQGQAIKRLVDESQNSGELRYTWDGTNTQFEPMPSGVYVYKLEVDGRSQTKKMLLLK